MVQQSVTELPSKPDLSQVTEQVAAATSDLSPPVVTPTVTLTEVPAEPVATETPAAEAPAENNLSNIEVTYEQPEPDKNADSPLDFIANDLVKALSFIPSLEPSLTSIRISSPGSEFDKLVKNSMEQLGYSFKRNRKQTPRQHLTTSFRETKRELQLSELTAIIAIDGTLIRRTYLIRDGDIEPATLYSIYGLDPQRVVSSDQINVL